MWCGYLEQVERCAHRVVDGDVGQSLCSKAVFGLPVERLVDTVSGGKLPRQLRRDLLVFTEVIWYSTACQHPDGFVTDAGFAGCGRMGVQLILGLPDGAPTAEWPSCSPPPAATLTAGCTKAAPAPRSCGRTARSDCLHPLGEVMEDFVCTVVEQVAGKRVGVEFVGAVVVHVGGVLLQCASDALQRRDQRADGGRDRNVTPAVGAGVAVPPVGPLAACRRAVGGVGSGVELGAAFDARWGVEMAAGRGQDD